MQGHYFKDGGYVFGAGGDEDGVVGECGDGGVAFGCYGEDLGALRLPVAEQVYGFVVAVVGVGGVGIAGGESYEGNRLAEESGGAVFELAGRVGFRLHVGGLFQLESAFAGDGEVDAAAEVEAGLGFCHAGGYPLDLGLPGGEPVGYGFGEVEEVLEAGVDGGVGEAAAGSSGEEGEKVEDEELGGEGLGGGDGFFDSGAGGEGAVGERGHGGGGVVGDGDGGGVAEAGFAECFEGVGGLAGLGDDEDAAGGGSMGGAVDVLAGVLDVDGEVGELFEEELADDAGVAAGAAGGDEHGVLSGEGVAGGEEGVVAEAGGVGEGGEGLGEGGGLLVDLAEHGVGEGHRRGTSCLVLGAR